MSGFVEEGRGRGRKWRDSGSVCIGLGLDIWDLEVVVRRMEVGTEDGLH